MIVGSECNRDRSTCDAAASNSESGGKRYRLVDINGKKTGVFHRYHKSGEVNGKKVAKKSLLIQNFFGAPVNNMIRKSALEKVGYFDESFTYILDFDMWVRLACSGDIYIIHQQLNSFRIRKIPILGI